MLKLKRQYTLATWCKELTPWKTPWCWGRLKPGEWDNRGWDGWMAWATRWTWVWVNSGSWWWTGMSGVLVHGVVSSQTRLSDWTELNWTLLGTESYKSMFRSSRNVSQSRGHSLGFLPPGQVTWKEGLSPPSSRAGRDAYGRKNPWLYMPLFFCLIDGS